MSFMNRMGGAGMLLLLLLAGVNDKVVHRLREHRRLLCGIAAGLGFVIVVVSTIVSPSFAPSEKTQLPVPYGKWSPEAEKTWTVPKIRGDNTNESTWTTRAPEWETRSATNNEDKNWAGLRKLQKQRADGSLWWDESAEQYFISKLEKSQFPDNCSKAHWIAKYDMPAGLLSASHVFQLPLFLSMIRGLPLVPISDPTIHDAFKGCGPQLADRNLHCFYNITHCDPGEDSARLTDILSKQQHEQRTTWDELLMEDDDFFPPGGVTVIITWKPFAWGTEFCVASSSFASFADAYTFRKLSLWHSMGRYGKTGVVSTPGKGCTGTEQDTRVRRVDMVIASILSSWMLNRVTDRVKLVADQIMSEYMDSFGQPLWKSPVLAIHVRQTDKGREDPYWRDHGVYRPIEDYALRMKHMEEEFGFQWPSIFIISDSGTALESLITVINGNCSGTPQRDDQRFIMHDWSMNQHLIEQFTAHNKVPEDVKNEMQVHFLASLYIVQKIADHAIVTYSSNVGRFISEIMVAKQRQAFVDREGPLITSLDDPWFWH